jgi:hypothetical protein
MLLAKYVIEPFSAFSTRGATSASSSSAAVEVSANWSGS